MTSQITSGLSEDRDRLRGGNRPYPQGSGLRGCFDEPRKSLGHLP